MDKEQGSTVQLIANLDTLQTLFSDLVQVESSPEGVILNFAQTLPGQSGEGPKARVLSRVVLTWPHFGRFVNMLQGTLRNNRDQAKEDFMHALFPENY